MDSLPYDAICHIYENLDTKSLCKMRMVSKTSDFKRYMSDTRYEETRKTIRHEKSPHIVRKILLGQAATPRMLNIHELSFSIYSLMFRYTFEENTLATMGRMYSSGSIDAWFQHAHESADDPDSELILHVDADEFGTEGDVIIHHKKNVSNDLLTTLAVDIENMKPWFNGVISHGFYLIH
jgi:hypothetical protein